ncbi:MAG: hypothetical protein JXB24_03470 [Bacteroidales bacterium]|nr:hypothetical protein [Bacteroidales bacterium]
MAGNNKEIEEKRFITETKASLNSKNDDLILAKIHELRSSGKASILPLILDLLNKNNSERVKREVILFISNLKDQKCVPFIADYIQTHSNTLWISQLISACWQSRLDYSDNLNIFTNCFLSGDYQVALESFTVIEEMVWRASNSAIESCKRILNEKVSDINDEKKPLYRELIKVLNEGKSNAKDE